MKVSEINVKEKIYNEIYDQVTNGKITSKDIITERALTEIYHVSKSPVREALLALCNDGILRSIPRVGYQIVPVSFQNVMNLIQLRCDIEVCGFRRSFEKITPDNILELKHIASKSHEILEKRERDDCDFAANSWKINYEFHSYLYSLSGNGFALNILEKLIRQSATYIAQYFIADWGRDAAITGAWHEKLIEAIEEKDLDKACTILMNDICSVKTQISALYQQEI